MNQIRCVFKELSKFFQKSLAQEDCIGFWKSELLMRPEVIQSTRLMTFRPTKLTLTGQHTFVKSLEEIKSRCTNLPHKGSIFIGKLAAATFSQSDTPFSYFLHKTVHKKAMQNSKTKNQHTKSVFFVLEKKYKTEKTFGDAEQRT